MLVIYRHKIKARLIGTYIYFNVKLLFLCTNKYYLLGRYSYNATYKRKCIK